VGDEQLVRELPVPSDQLVQRSQAVTDALLPRHGVALNGAAATAAPLTRPLSAMRSGTTFAANGVPLRAETPSAAIFRSDVRGARRLASARCSVLSGTKERSSHLWITTGVAFCAS